MKKVAIIGGGFSGLSVAWALCKEAQRQNWDTKIDLYEKQPHLGGLLQTQKNVWGLVEPAANSLLMSAPVEEMAKDFGITWAKKKKTARKRWVMTTQGPSRWPLSMWHTLKNLDRLLAVAQGKSKWMFKDQETLKQWGGRVFRSPQVIDEFMGPALSGVYASRAEELSASLCLSSLFQKPQPKSKGSMAPQGGMLEFFEKGEQFLKQHNVSLHLGFDVGEVKSLEADIIIDCRPNALGLKLNYNHMSSVSVFWPQEARPQLEGFGCLFPQSDTYIGVLFDSDIFEGRTTPNVFLEKWIIKNPEPKTQWTDQDTQNLLEFRFKNLSLQNKNSDSLGHIEPLKVCDFSISRALPKYDLHLESQLSGATKKYFMGTKIYVDRHNDKHIYHGNYLGEIGLNKILHKSLHIAKYVGDITAEGGGL